MVRRMKPKRQRRAQSVQSSSNSSSWSRAAVWLYKWPRNVQSHEATQALERLGTHTQDWLGLAEFSEVLAIKKNNLSTQRKRGKFPVPQFELAMGPVWGKEQVRVWLQQEKYRCQLNRRWSA